MLAILSLGSGLLVERSSGRGLPGVLLLPLGFAAIVLLSQLTTYSDATAELNAPLVILVAVLGGGFTKRRKLTIAKWPAAAALGTFALYAAPIVFSGEATFAGYLKLDDTANWLAVTDRLLEHGRSVEGLNPSTYLEALKLYVGVDNWYPVGSLTPLGVGTKLVGQDLAWTFQPYMAYLSAMLALTLTSIAKPLVGSWRLAAAAGFVAAQPALLVGYVFWGGVKEISGAVLIALVAVFAPMALRADAKLRDLVPVSVCAAAVFFALSFGGGAWLIPLPFLALTLYMREGRSLKALVRPVAICCGLVVCLGLPILLSGKIAPTEFSSLTNPAGDALGNLVKPLSIFQAVGIWPSGDFRFAPDLPALTYIAIAIALMAAVYGFWRSWKSAGWTMLFYSTMAAIGMVLVVAVADAWIGGKALAMSSPGVLLPAAVGSLMLLKSKRRLAGYVATTVIVAGVFGSYAMAYHEMTLAPRPQLVELEDIGKQIAGEGPTLITEFQPYGDRYFLRDADPEAPGDIGPRLIPLANGGSLTKSQFADTDELSFPDLQTYRTLVLRRSPAQSRPPAEYKLIWSGDYYEVWQRPPEPAAQVTHIPLGQTLSTGAGVSIDRVGVPDCSQVRELASSVGPGGALTAAPGFQPVVIPLAGASYPSDWTFEGNPNYLLPRSGGELTTTVTVERAGSYDLWLGGSLRGKASASIDGEPVGTVRHQINNLGQYIDFGPVLVSAGIHSVELSYSVPLLQPGSGGEPFPIGPLLLGTSASDSGPLVKVSADQARTLCGRPWDWIEAQG